MMLVRFNPRFCLLILPVLLAACVPHMEALPMPRGYAHLDATPVSSPHGYKIDPVRDDRIKQERSENASDWAAASADLVARLAPVLEGRPSEIAIRPAKTVTPVSGAFDFALREAVTNQGFMLSPDAQAPTLLKYDAQITPNTRLKEDAFLDLSLRLAGATGADIAEARGTYKIRHQEVETARLPGFTGIPTPGIRAEKPARAVNN